MEMHEEVGGEQSVGEDDESQEMKRMKKMNRSN